MENSSKNAAFDMTIITTDATTIHTNGEPTVHIEHFFDIKMLEGLGLSIQCILLLCAIRGYFNDPMVIYT